MSRGIGWALAFAATLLTACATSTKTTPPATGIQRFAVDLGGGVSLNYTVERKTSGVRNDACFSLLTGTLSNASATTLSRSTVVDFKVISGGQMLFRDITQPVTDIPPGTRADLKLIASPTHRGECPPYERIDVALRRVDAQR
jgi:hypothetical protein